MVVASKRSSIRGTMPSVEASELRADLGKVLDEVRDNASVVDVTQEGRLVARIEPPPLRITLTPLDQLSHAITGPFDAVEAVREQRREL